MTKLTHHSQNQHHRSYITPQHEERDLPSLRDTSVVYRQTVDPGQRHEHRHQPIQPGYASLPINPKRDSSEPCADKAEEFLIPHQGLHDDLNVLTFDVDRMSEHDPSSGDGEEEPQPPELAPYQGNTQWNSPKVGIRPPQPGGSTNTSAMTGKAASTKPAAASSSDGRRVHGQAFTSLPAEKVFPIQVGSEVFRLSGASISSDGPSYFTQFFEDQIRQNEETGGVRTLYIDRDPETFRDIARHLQGYFVKPKDGPHFVRLFADAQFYSLPRLISQLFESEIFIQIGEQHFQIPKDIFSDPGNSPNYFSLGFAVFFSTPNDSFPGLDRRGLLRPPPINPPYVPGRSSEIFAQLLHLLRGYPLRIRDEQHRAELLRDCRFFYLRGLEQRIIAHDISYNLERQKFEICLRLDDLKPSGISYRPDEADSSATTPSESGWVTYARPFVDEQSYELVVEIGGESAVLDIDEMRLDFHGKTKARVASLFQVVANKMGLPSNQPLGLIMLSGGNAKRSPSPGHSPLSEDKVRVRLETIADVALDNKPLSLAWESEQGRHMRTGRVDTVTVDDDAEDSTSVSDEPRSNARPPSTTSTSQKGTAVPLKPTRPPLSRSSQSDASTFPPPPKKRKAESISPKFGKWIIRNGQWRLRVEQSTNAARGKYEIVLIAVKLDAYTDERARNIRREFLG